MFLVLSFWIINPVKAPIKNHNPPQTRYVPIIPAKDISEFNPKATGRNINKVTTMFGDGDKKNKTIKIIRLISPPFNQAGDSFNILKKISILILFLLFLEY